VVAGAEVADAGAVLAGEDVLGLGDVPAVVGVPGVVGVGDALGGGGVVAGGGVLGGIDGGKGVLVAGEEVRPEAACAEVEAAGAMRGPAAPCWTDRVPCDELVVPVRVKPAVAPAPSSAAMIAAAASGRQRRSLGRRISRRSVGPASSRPEGGAARAGTPMNVRVAGSGSQPVAG
jgi:hypothetical protein